MRRILVLVLVLVLVAGCGGAPPEPEPPKSLLTPEIEAEIRVISADIDRVEEERDKVSVWVNLSFDPTSHEQLAGIGNEIADKVAALFDYEVYVVVNLKQDLEGDKVRMFGASRLYPGNAVEYKPF